MDWSALKNKAVSLGNKAAEAGLSALEKASAHTYEGLKKTAVSIKSGEDLDAAKSQPLLLLLVIGKEDPATKAVLARMPVIFKDAWVYSASVRVVLSEETPDLAAVLGAVEYPVAIVFRKGEQERRFDGAAALEFVKNLDLARPKPEAAPVPQGMVDVVAQAAAGVPMPAPAPVPAPASAPVPAAPAPSVPAPVTPSAPVPESLPVAPSFVPAAPPSPFASAQVPDSPVPTPAPVPVPHDSVASAPTPAPAVPSAPDAAPATPLPAAPAAPQGFFFSAPAPQTPASPAATAPTAPQPPVS